MPSRARQTILNPHLVLALTALVREMPRGPAMAALEAVLSALAATPVRKIAQAGQEVANLTFSQPPRRGVSMWIPANPLRPWTERDLILREPRYAWLFIFHHNGYVRHAALEAIRSPPTSAFFFAAIALRLNDWVPQVRAAAMACAARVLGDAAPSVAALSATALLDRRLVWSRWDSEFESLDAIFGRADVVEKLADHLSLAGAGPRANWLRHALRYPNMDAQLARLAADAVNPAVRAVALQTLVTRIARWPVGFEWRWIDKVYGKRHRVAVYEDRPIAEDIPVAVLINAGVYDRSPMVRRVAADALMSRRTEVPNAQMLIERLAIDKSAALRSRADFLLRQGELPAAES
jgi:hypothetical protein